MNNKKEEIAIIGMAHRFPQDIDSYGKYWSALCKGQDLVTEIDPERWDSRIFKNSRPGEPGKSYVFAAGQLKKIKEFDADFFGISPREASQMDPQQRLLLELSWEAIEDAAVNPQKLAGSDCAVYVGIASNDYVWRRSDDLSSADAYFMTGSTASIASNRISYIFNLRGPSMSIDTACSSSLVALHQACNCIWGGEVSQALVGGVNLLLHPFGFVGFSKASMLSAKGQCRAFDASGDGYVRSEGCAVFYLKRLSDAERDGDRIHAVIKNTAVNSDGKTNGITMPSIDGQSKLLKQVYNEVGIDVNDIDYIEAHGTGTPVGDPIETKAIGETIAKQRSHKHVLPIGSVKTNVGHMETASGMAGLLKAVLCVKNRAIPPNLHFDNPNPNIDFDGLNIEVVDTYREFSKSEKPLVVGVNSFGFGGTNSHVVIQEYKRTYPSSTNVSQDLERLPPLFLSAASRIALQEQALNYSNYLQENSAWYYDVAHQLAHKRAHLSEGMAIHPISVSAAISALEKFSEGESCEEIVTQHLVKDGADISFVYSGNGSQWLGMGTKLLQNDSTFASDVAEVDELLTKHMGLSMIDELQAEQGKGRFHLTEIAQPALFAIQVGITKWLARKGITPASVTGHSVGEVSAAWASGALSLKQAVQVIYERSTAQGLTRGTGRMAAMGHSEQDALVLLSQTGLDKTIEIAGINSPKSVSLAGPLTALEKLESIVNEHGGFYRILDLDYAFHSRYMDPIKDRLLNTLESLRPNPTKITMVSSVTGKPIDGRQLTAKYWWDNIRQPVRFGAAIENLISEDHLVFMDIGPHPIMRGYINEGLRANNIKGLVCPTIKKDSDEIQELNKALLTMHLAGCYMDLETQFPYTGIHMDLPKYPWQHQEYWHSLTDEGYNLVGRVEEHCLLGYRIKPDLAHWEQHFDVDTTNYLADHRVGGGAIMPAAGYAEMALAASYVWYDHEQHEIDDLEILSPLLLETDSLRTVRTELEPEQGHFKIKSRLRLSEDPWTVHAVGRILTAIQAVPTLCAPSIVDDFGTRLSHQQHYQITSNVGLDYGEAFRGISEVLIDGDRAIGILNSEHASSDSNSHQLHPIYLDACFQSLAGIVALSSRAEDKKAMIPVRIGSLKTYSNSTPKSFRTTVTKHNRRSILADFELFDAEENIVAQAHDCRFRSVKFVDHTEKTLSYRYNLIRKRNLVLNTSSEAFPLIEAINDVRASLDSEPNLKRRDRLFNEVLPLYDALVACYAYEALTEIVGAQHFAIDDLFSNFGVAPEHQYLCSRLIQILLEENWIEESEDHYQLVSSSDIPDSQAIWLTLIGDYSAFAPEILTLGRAGKNLCSLLLNQIDADKLFSTDFANTLTEHKYDSSPYHANSNAFTQQLIEHWIGNQGASSYRVLHFGSGHQTLMPFVLSNLHSHSDYVYVHENEDICASARTQTSLHTRAKSEQLSIDSKEQFESFRDESALFDLVILNEQLALFSQPDIALTRIRELMSPNALIICLEDSPSRYSDLTSGINEDWWHRSIDTKSPQSLRISGKNWITAFQNSNFESATVQYDDPSEVSGSYVIAATNPDSLRQLRPQHEKWLFISSAPGDHSDQLIECLHSHSNISVSHLFHRAKTAMSEHHLPLSQSEPCFLDLSADLSWQQIVSSEALEAFDKVLYLSDVIDSSGAKSPQSKNLMHFMSIAKSMNRIKSDSVPQLVLISQGGCPNTAQLHPEKLLPDAELWGFSRVLRNEMPQLNCRQIDWISDSSSRDANEQLIDEILSNAPDEEVVLLYPERHILSLDTIDLNEAAPKVQSNIQLSFNDPGLLKNLIWIPMPSPVPGPNEVTIKPKASGLNFRDVMYAMGLLSDEAVENGFAGATLGMECSGTVIAVGSKVTQWKAGDQVMGFAPACFSSIVLTNEDAIAAIPPNWSFEEAATIPTTFFTAYYALKHLAQLQPGERVLIHGGAGGVGIAAIQIANFMDAEVFVTAGTDEKRDFVELLGADKVLNSRSLNFANDIMEITDGEGIDVVLNSLAGEAINKNLKILRPFGRFLELGKRDFYENSRIGLRPFRNNISYFGIDADQLMIEKPKLTARLFRELIQIFLDGSLRPLPYRSFSAKRVEEAFRYMQQSKHIGKILLTYEEMPTIYGKAMPYKMHSLDPNATYLVTGGLRGFGLETAKWLASQGARHLTLVSRSGDINDLNHTSIEYLCNQGVFVEARAVDVTCKEELENLFASFGGDLPELKGIVHAATVYDDCLIETMGEEQLQSVLRPKVIGATLLDKLSENLNLDLFVLFSSVTTSFGNPGQANYVAANLSLEAIAESRRARGLSATYVGWGPIADAGYLTRNEDVAESLESRMGSENMTSAQALDHLGPLIASKVSGAIISEMNWGRMKKLLPIAQSVQFNTLNWLAEQQGSDLDDGENLCDTIKDMNHHDALLLVSEILAKEIAAILRIPSEKIDFTSSVFDLGMDSLMGVELAMAVEKRFQVNMPAMALSEGPSISKISERVVSKILGNQEETEASDSLNESAKRLAAIHNEKFTGEHLEKIKENIDQTNTVNSSFA